MILAAAFALIVFGAPEAELDKPQPVNATGWFTPDDYPADALRKHQEGSVSYSVEVDANGAPSSCSIALSSGSQSLDATTCGIVMQRAQFTPAHTAGGVSVSSRFDGRIRWKLPSAGPQKLNSMVEFSGSSEEPHCSLLVDGKSRRLIADMCKALVTSVLARGGTRDKPEIVSIPSDPIYLEPE